MCLARMWLDVADDGRVRLRFLRNHNHPCSAEHVSIPRRVRDFIAGQSAAGIPPAQVLENVLATFFDQERAKMITLQDVNNIARSCERHQLTAEEIATIEKRIDAHLKQQQQQQQQQQQHVTAPLLVLKFPNQSALRALSAAHEELQSHVAVDDFALILQTSAQRRLMRVRMDECVPVCLCAWSVCLSVVCVCRLCLCLPLCRHVCDWGVPLLL